MSKSVSASELSTGSWIAQFGGMIIWIRSADGSWTARVSSMSHGSSVIVRRRGVFSTCSDAVEWACSLLRQHGARAFVDGQEQRLEKFLAFSRAPEPCA